MKQVEKETRRVDESLDEAVTEALLMADFFQAAQEPQAERPSGLLRFRPSNRRGDRA